MPEAAHRIHDTQPEFEHRVVHPVAVLQCGAEELDDRDPWDLLGVLEGEEEAAGRPVVGAAWR